MICDYIVTHRFFPDNAHVNDSVGPARYSIDHHGLGSKAPKWSPSGRQDVESGPPNHLVQPVDSHGFDTPGPNYRPNSSYWGRGPKKSFGSSRRCRATVGPGPAEYSVPEKCGGVAFSLAKRLPQPPTVQQGMWADKKTNEQTNKQTNTKKTKNNNNTNKQTTTTTKPTHTTHWNYIVSNSLLVKRR